MPRPRVPLDKAIASGAAQHDPQRFKNRQGPKKKKPLGPPYAVMSDSEKAAWLDMAGDMPWLHSGHRVLLRLASQVVARMDEGTLPVSAINSLSAILSKLGATPVDETKVNHASDPDEDPDDRFFGGKTN